MHSRFLFFLLIFRSYCRNFIILKYMKHVVLLLAAGVLLSCAKKSEENIPSKIDSAVIRLPDTAYISVNQTLLDKFKTTEQDEFIFTPPKHIRQPMRGTKQVGAQYLPIFPSSLKIGNTKRPEVFAIQKFKIDNNTTALVTQNPGDFALSSINLMLYNHQAEAVSGLLEVADETDEKGYKSKKQTVLVRDSGHVKGLMWYSTRLEPVDADDPTNLMTTNEYFSISINNGKIDTAKATQEQINELRRFFK